MRKLLLLALAGAAAWAADSCVDCHSKLEGAQQAPATAFTADIHRRAGFSCADCHGGDRSTSDMDASMSKARGFRGKIARKDVPQLCARCHSDANLIHKHKPQQRVDQYAQYQTSVHGKKLAAGDTAAANCVDCHSVHDIREVKNALSPVHPLRLPETCARCHADAAKMAKYKLDTHQFEQYRKSVHWEALAKRGDLSAPSCASCHGNHGAAPPQVSSVAAVCGTCHVLFEDLYKKSPHQPVFAAMGAGGCVVCHENHGIVKPSTEMLAGARSVCVQCHDAASAGGATAAKMAEQIGKLSAALDKSDGILRRARESGMEISEAQLKQIEGRENLIKSRVAVHAFQVAAVEKPVNDGMVIAGETWKAGENALKERDWRRVGLAAALVTILVTMTGLGLAIRSIERRPEAVDNPTGR
ncbi:MAG: cytochrome c3 family protein [Acidobacteria bacterium]|nr:cytochrome c3 family protein [Acidobacteriota bacterium]